jgi:hypothetical protein
MHLKTFVQGISIPRNTPIKKYVLILGETQQITILTHQVVSLGGFCGSEKFMLVCPE